MKRTDWLLCVAKNCDWFKFKIQKILNRALSSSVHLSSNRSQLECENNNLLLTERKGRTGEYWPEVVTVRTSLLGPYENDRGPIFPGTARASSVSK